MLGAQHYRTTPKSTQEMHLINSEADLALFWEEAARPIPLVIVGAGRWGRVWASVAASARGCGNSIAIVTRQNAAEVHASLARKAETRSVKVFEDIGSAFPGIKGLHLAIVASRPVHHVPDAALALEAGYHVIVEKPLSVNPQDARELIDAAKSRGLKLGVGTEFALLPVFHDVAREINTHLSEIKSIGITWYDPSHEVRHGLTKRRHDEITAVENLFSHAVSIFRIFCRLAGFTLISVSEDGAALTGGVIRFEDREARTFELLFDLSANVRRRIVDIRFPSSAIKIDFGGSCPIVTTTNMCLGCANVVTPFHSSLRLELGAFNAHVRLGRSVSLIDQLPDLLCFVHEQIVASTGCTVNQ